MKKEQKARLLKVMFTMNMAFAMGALCVPAMAADADALEVTQQNTITVTGQVKDAYGPVAGATVVVKGTSNGATTDVDGNYSIKGVRKGQTLVFSFIGYKTQEIAASKSTIDVTLAEDAVALNEVVAIGYGYVKKKDLTGAISTVSANEMVLGGTVSNAAQALQGKTAGVQVQQTSKAPGGSISVRVRGSNSISSSNEPLYVVDGFPSTEGLNINPNDIESMQILKDASATAIYGARGANGVVLITTKRGKSGENKISYNGYVGVQQMTQPFEMLNAQEYMKLGNELYKELDGHENDEYGAYTQTQLARKQDTDWIKECTRLGLVHDHNLAFRGGSDKTKVMTSLGYFNQEGILKNTSFNRISGRVNVDQTVNDYIKAGANLYAHREMSNTQSYSGNILNSNVLLSILSFDPAIAPYNPDGTYGRPENGRGDNPLCNLLERKNEKTIDKLDGTAYVEIAPFKGFTAKATAGIETLHEFQGSYLPASTYQGGIDKGVASTYDYSSTRQLFEGILNYTTTIKEKHDLSVMLGYTYEKFTGEYRKITAKNFATDLYEWNNLAGAAQKESIGSNKTENILVSFFGRVNYTFNDKYLVTATVRRDGSSRFGVNNHWGTFPSGSIAWRASEEDFIKNLNVFSNLKVRAGVGVTGNERIADYASYALISATHFTLDGSTTQSGTHINTGAAENSKLKWESTTQYNFGIDMGFLNNRLAVTVDAYYKKTSDLLLNVSTPLYTGYTSAQQNIGSISNAGVELDITSHNFQRKNFTWDTKFNISFNKNKVLNLGRNGDIFITSAKPMGTVSEQQYAIVREGEALGSLFGFKYWGVLQSTTDTSDPSYQYASKTGQLANAKPGDPLFYDVNEDKEITSDDRTIIGHASPDFIFGLTNTFTWKNFDLNVFFQGSVGNDLLNMTRMNLEWNRTTDALNRWTPSNTNTDLPRNGFYYAKKGSYLNDHFVEDASFVRLKNLTLGYTIPFKKVVSSCRLYVSLENLFTITGYSGWDPEVDTKGYEYNNSSSKQTANAGAGLDFNSYPAMRTYTFGLNITF